MKLLFRGKLTDLLRGGYSSSYSDGYGSGYGYGDGYGSGYGCGYGDGYGNGGGCGYLYSYSHITQANFKDYLLKSGAEVHNG